MSILSVPLTALPLTSPESLPAFLPAVDPAAPELATAGLTENDRMAMPLSSPWHAETLRHARTGEVLLVACDCMLDRDHSYAERMAWPAGLMQRD